MSILHPGHTKRATMKGATAEEIMEAIWVAAEMRAGAASARILRWRSMMTSDSLARPPIDITLMRHAAPEKRHTAVWRAAHQIAQ